ncbi:MOSC domain-containing protein [Paraclostridium benzoelyticum]|uniref:MOSC domain-containing protein n=1 Tax=Paraclostridium benzoelyticum TaxID=1629550 RepID=UPI000ADE19A7
MLGDESIEKIRQMGIEGLCTGKFAENITTKDIVLYELPVGTKLKIGDTIQEVTQIGKKCHAGCAIKNQVGDCVMPREGIFTKIIKGGEVRPGDTIEVIEE